MRKSVICRCIAVMVLAAAGINILVGARPAGAASPGTRPATVPALAPQDLYAQIVDKYLKGDWGTLPPDFAQAKVIAAMTKDQQADVVYMKQAVADGRPAWWDQVKQGAAKVPMPTRMWGKGVSVVFDPKGQPGMVNMQQTGGGPMTFTVSWLMADMDSPTQAEHGFTKGDLNYLSIWGTFEAAYLFSGMNLQNFNNMDQNARLKWGRFQQFRTMLAGGYYGTPRARRWVGFLCGDAYAGAHLTNDGFIPDRPIAAFLEEEIVSHIGKYPSIRLPRNLRAENAEASLATNLMGQFERTMLTFPEDKSLRDALKDFALANGTAAYAGGKVLLPSKMSMPLDPAEDAADGATVRGQWLMEEIANPGVHAAAATKAATKPSTTASRPATRPAATRP